MKSIVIVTGFAKAEGGMSPVSLSLWQGLSLPVVNTEDKPVPFVKKEGAFLGQCRSFRTTREQLAKVGMYLTSAFINEAGKAVFEFTAGDPSSENTNLVVEFDTLFMSSGWSVVEYDHEDGVVVFAARGAVKLSDEVRAPGSKAKQPRDWSKTEVSFVFPEAEE